MTWEKGFHQDTGHIVGPGPRMVRGRHRLLESCKSQRDVRRRGLRSASRAVRSGGHVGAVARLFEARNADRQSSEPTKPKPRVTAAAGLETHKRHKKPAFGRTSAPPTQRDASARGTPRLNLTHNLGYTTNPPARAAAAVRRRTTPPPRPLANDAPHKPQPVRTSLLQLSQTK